MLDVLPDPTKDPPLPGCGLPLRSLFYWGTKVGPAGPGIAQCGLPLPPSFMKRSRLKVCSNSGSSSIRNRAGNPRRSRASPGRESGGSLAEAVEISRDKKKKKEKCGQWVLFPVPGQ